MKRRLPPQGRPDGASRRSVLLLPVALAAQAALLIPRIGLLPVWGDEQFTLDVIEAPIHRMLDLLRDDFHPPLYFLFLKLWVWLMPGSAVADKARLASVALGLLATVAIDRLWLRDLPPRSRRWFLLVWVLSPFLLLYARMARSYTAQLLIAVFAIRYAVDWLRRPDTMTALRYAIAEVVLLYVHYVPGLAIGGAFGLFGLYRMARGERDRVTSFLIVVLVCGALYVPWVAPLATAIGRGIGTDLHRMVPSAVLEHAMRLAYAFLSLNFGETMPIVGLVLAAAIAPALGWTLAQGVPGSREWLPFVLGTLPIAYAMTSNHVGLQLTPSRLPFLLPYGLLLFVRGCERRPKVAAIVLPATIAASLLAAASYHQKQDFLNKGYLIPFDTIASYASRSLPPGEALFVIDTSNMDATPLMTALPSTVPALPLYDDASSGEVHRRIARSPVTTVWLLRRTHDVSPGRWNTRAAAELGRVFRCVRRTGYVAYGSVDRLAMRALGWPERPDHVLELLEFERAPAAGAPPSTGSRCGPSAAPDPSG